MKKGNEILLDVKRGVVEDSGVKFFGYGLEQSIDGWYVTLVRIMKDGKSSVERMSKTPLIRTLAMEKMKLDVISGRAFEAMRVFDKGEKH